MDFFLKFIAFMFLVYVIQSTEIVKNMTFFKLNENMIYECVDIYQQPSLNHPLLKNHKIQMEPSFSIFKQKNKVKSESEYKSKKIIKCPNGTVPILRNTKSYVANAIYWAEKHFNPLTVKSHGIHIAGVRVRNNIGPYHGLGAWMSVHDLNITKDQTSYATIYVGNRDNNRDNYIQTGWMVNPSVFGDGRTWSYGFWKGANGVGCYNTICHGFVQVSKTKPLSRPFPYPRYGERAMHVSIRQDEDSGHWWTSYVRYNISDIHIGYWPKELFDLIDKGVDMIGVGGVVQASPSGISPPMGNGHLPNEDEDKSARVTDVEILDDKFKVRKSYEYKFEKMLDNNKCYGLKHGKDLGPFRKPPILFTYGGPGGDSCGI